LLFTEYEVNVMRVPLPCKLKPKAVPVLVVVAEVDPFGVVRATVEPLKLTVYDPVTVPVMAEPMAPNDGPSYIWQVDVLEVQLSAI
jgi:hypothetical protein